MQVYLVRHAQSRQNVNDPENHPYRPEVEEYERGRYEYGDYSLTEFGHWQADRAGRRLAQIEFDAALCSPLHRHVATANGILRYQKNKKLELINDLFEKGIHSYAGMPIDLLAWTLAIGTDIGGNATPIGASANVVGTSVSAKAGHPIGWGKYCRYCVPATVIVLTISMICLFVRYV